MGAGGGSRAHGGCVVLGEGGGVNRASPSGPAVGCRGAMAVNLATGALPHLYFPPSRNDGRLAPQDCYAARATAGRGRAWEWCTCALESLGAQRATSEAPHTQRPATPSSLGAGRCSAHARAASKPRGRAAHDLPPEGTSGGGYVPAIIPTEPARQLRDSIRGQRARPSTRASAYRQLRACTPGARAPRPAVTGRPRARRSTPGHSRRRLRTRPRRSVGAMVNPVTPKVRADVGAGLQEGRAGRGSEPSRTRGWTRMCGHRDWHCGWSRGRSKKVTSADSRWCGSLSRQPLTNSSNCRV